MPIRFRCPHCSRLLGIARRKAGTQIQCPQCQHALTVPVADTDEQGQLPGETDRKPAAVQVRNVAIPDQLQWPEAPLPATPPRHAPPATSWPHPTDLPEPAPVLTTPEHHRPSPRPSRPSGKSADAPLFERQDFDAMLGLPPTQPDLEPNGTNSRAKKVSGMDAQSLDGEDEEVVLSGQKITLIIVLIMVMIAMAFAAGFFIASRI